MDVLTLLSLLAIAASAYLLLGNWLATGDERTVDYFDSFESLRKKLDGVLIKSRTAGSRCFLEIDLAVSNNRMRLSTEALQDDDKKVTSSWIMARGYLASMNQDDLRIHISRIDLLDDLSSLIGFESVRTGFADFDNAYCIKSNKPQEAQKLLNITLQRDIGKLFKFTKSNVVVQLHKYALVVRVEAHIGAKNVARWATIVNTMFENVLHYLKKEGKEEEEIPPMRKPWLPQGQICSFCGEPIVVETALCRRCATSYHRTCWDYHGACQTYDCHCDELR